MALAAFTLSTFDPAGINASLLTMEEGGGPGSTRRRYKYLLRRSGGLAEYNPSVELSQLSNTNYVIVSHETRHVDHGTWELVLETELISGLPVHWVVETRANTQSVQTFRDASGQLILSYYGQEAPRLHQVPAVLGGYEIIMRRYMDASSVASLLPLAGCVPATNLVLTPCYGVQNITVPAHAALCTGVRFDLTHPALSVGIIEISFSIPKQMVVNGIGAWDTTVIWADANGVTPPDAEPCYYYIQPRAEFNVSPIVEVQQQQ